MHELKSPQPYRSLHWARVIVGIVLLFVLIGTSGWTASESTSTGTFRATADTFVESTTPDRNYGQHGELQADNYPGVKRTLIRFHVTEVPEGASVTSATLRLFVTDGSKKAGTIQAVEGDWSEASTTWLNAPAVGGKIGDISGRARVGTWVEADVTPALTGNGDVNFYVMTASSNGVRYRSSEGSDKPPTLILRWAAPAGSTPSPAPTPTSSLTPTPTSSPTPVTFTPMPVPTSVPTPIPPPTPTSAPPPPSSAIWKPDLNTSWQWQLTGSLDLSVAAKMFDVDLFDVSAAQVQAIHAKGSKAVCYISAGSWENWRPDAGSFPASVKGKNNGWPGEMWLDIRNLAVLGPIMEARLDLCVSKGFDGVEFDNVDGYTNNTGFPLTYGNQLAYNKFLANAAHARGLSAGLKNDVEQVVDLLPFFDWALNEECFQYNECDTLLPFVQAGKAVFVVEYELSTNQFCPQANAMNFNAMRKHLDLDAFREPCR